MPLDGELGFDFPVPRDHLQEIMGTPATLIGHHIDGNDFHFNKEKSGNGRIVFTGAHSATGVVFDVTFDCQGNITDMTQSNSSAQIVVRELSL